MAVYGLGKPLFIDGRCGFLLVQNAASYCTNAAFFIGESYVPSLAERNTLFGSIQQKSGSLFAEQVTLCWQVNGSSIGTTVPVYLAQHDARYSAAAAALSWRSMCF